MEKPFAWVRPLVPWGLVLGLALFGCAGFHSQPIDPSGAQLAPPPPPGGRIADPLAPVYREIPPPVRLWDRVGLTLSPQECIAPIRSEVILVAGVIGSDNYLRTNEPVHWTIDPAGVGQFAGVCPGSFVDYLVGDFTRPRVASGNFAVTSTSRRYQLLTRGTPRPDDDVPIVAGQTWVSVTSAVEGTTVVTAFAPRVRDWTQRTQTARIHWIDAQWTLPPPAIVAAGGRHTLVTTVTRQSDQSPCVNWIVRYEIISGPRAQLAPGGQVVEVSTDSSGRAAAEIFEMETTAGTTCVSIQVIRPGGPEGRRLVVGRGSTHISWSAPGLSIRKLAPTVAAVGGSLNYRIEVSNTGDLPASKVTVTDRLPSGLTLIRVEPPPTASGNLLSWSFDSLAAGQIRSITLECRPERAGRFENTVEATAAGNLAARSTAGTEVSVPQLQLRVTGPERATVGQSIQFSIDITNGSSIPLAGLLVKARFDPGLEHAVAASPIERDLGRVLQPGETHRIGVEFRVVRVGRHCTTIELLSDNVVLASAQGCVTAEAQTPGPTPPTTPEVPPPTGPPPPQVPRAVTPKVTVRVLAPASAQVGEMVEFVIELSNAGATLVRDLRLSCRLDPPLQPRFATGGFEPRPAGELLAPFVWRRDTLPAGQTLQYRVQCTAQQAAAQACLQVRLTGPDGLDVTETKCVKIQETSAAITPSAPAGALRLSVEPLQSRIAQGGRTTIVIRVTNSGTTPQDQVQVTASVPVPLERIKFGTLGPTGTDDPTFEDSTIRFAPVLQLAPGETAEFRLVVSGKQTGQGSVRVQVVSRQQPQAATDTVVIDVAGPTKQIPSR